MEKSKAIKAKILETRHFGFIIGLFFFLLFIVLTYGIGVIKNFEKRILDLNFNLKFDVLSNQYGEKEDEKGVFFSKPNPKVSNDILLIGIDNNSLDRFGNWPFPRSIHADLVNTFTRIDDQTQRERALFLDINFIERDLKTPLNDALLVESIKQNQRVFLEAFFHSVEFKKELSLNYQERVKLFFDKFGAINNNQLQGDWQKLYNWHSVEAPLKPYIEACNGYGNVTADPDEDNIFRRQPLLTRLSVPVKDIRLESLTINEEIKKEQFEYLGWLDKQGNVHKIEYPITNTVLSNLKKEMKEKAPPKSEDINNDGNITSYYIVTKYRDYIVPTIALTLACEYFNTKLSDAEIVLGKYIKIKNPQSYNIITNEWEPMIKKPALYTFPRVIDVYDFENNIVAKISENKEKLELLHNFFYKSTLFEKYVLIEGIRKTDQFKIEKLLFDIGYPKIKLLHTTEYYSEITIPIDARANMLINYIGKPSGLGKGSNKNYSLSSFSRYVNDPGPNKKNWRMRPIAPNKVVIVGMFTTGLGDEKPTPYGLMYGPELNANALNTVLMNNFLVYAPWYIDLMILFGIILVISFIASRLPTLVSLGISLLVIIMLFVAVQILFDSFNYIIIFSAPALASVITFISIVTYRVMTEEKEKKKIKTMFGKYLSPQVVDSLLANPPELGGVDKDITVLFSDIRGFTTLSETMSPQELVNHLNLYLTAMADIIYDYGGYLDKYVGDEIMCFWGAPSPEPEHALLACQCALKQIEELNRLNKGWPPERRIDIGIGLNSGIMTVGNMGSPDKKNYTAMGDNVNLGARLEGTNKTYKTTIIMSEYTHSLVKDKVIARELDNLKVKGKNRPVLIYELVDMVDSYNLPERLKKSKK